MGGNIGPILTKKGISFEDLANKTVAIDAYNTLYQFLSIIRQRDGTPLMSSKGSITSHLSGIFYRTSNMLKEGIKPVYVFDGKPPLLKFSTIDKRKAVRDEAIEKYIIAKENRDFENAIKYAQMSTRLSHEIIDEAVTLLKYLGVPCVFAPAEGEAQAAFMTIKGDADIVASQDYDSLLFGSTNLVRNLAVSGRRKLPNKNEYVNISPELYILNDILEEYGIEREALVDIAILVGTDYNDGIKNIGPKKALKLVKEYGNIENVLAAIDKNIENLDEIKNIFLHPAVTEEYRLVWYKPNDDKLIEFLCDEHDFARERVVKTLNEINTDGQDKINRSKTDQQRTLGEWF
jgi:flap endonuclease-1